MLDFHGTSIHCCRHLKPLAANRYNFPFPVCTRRSIFWEMLHSVAGGGGEGFKKNTKKKNRGFSLHNLIPASQESPD